MKLLFSAKRTDQDHHGIIDMTAFNTDGFDVTGRNVWIHDCNVWDQDDCIAVKVNFISQQRFFRSCLLLRMAFGASLYKEMYKGEGKAGNDQTNL